MYAKYMKRLLDILLSLTILVVLSPLLLVLCILVRSKLGSPIFFKQERPGLHEKIFTMYKFRTMTDKRDAEGNLLRATSLDELPEFFNILKGDMSFIGPRPLLVSYLPYYTETEALRHTVRPGLTGLAQVSGRNFLDWDRRLAKDVEYVKGLSFQMDLKVLFLTVKVVFDRSDVAEDTSQAEGNFARIRQERLDRTGRLEA